MVKLKRSDFIVLSFSGKRLDPDKITEKIGIPPFTQAKLNEFSTGFAYASGYFPKCPIKSKTGYWNEGTHSNSKQKIEIQFSQLTKRFKRCRDAIVEVMSWDSIDEAYIEIVVKPSYKDADYSCRLRSKDLEFWSSLGIDVIFTCWVPGWDKDLDK